VQSITLDSFSGQGRTQAWELLDLCILRFQEVRKEKLKGAALARVHSSNLKQPLTRERSKSQVLALDRAHTKSVHDEPYKSEIDSFCSVGNLKRC